MVQAGPGQWDGHAGWGMGMGPGHQPSSASHCWARWPWAGALSSPPCSLLSVPGSCWGTQSPRRMWLLSPIQAKGQPVPGSFPRSPETSLPFGPYLRVRADARSLWELLEVGPHVIKRSRRGSDCRLGPRQPLVGKGLISGSGQQRGVGTEGQQRTSGGESGGSEESRQRGMGMGRQS